MRYAGNWVRLGRADRARAEAGAAIEHHRYWDKALHSARARVPKGEKGPFRVERYVKFAHTNPGWVDGYKIELVT